MNTFGWRAAAGVTLALAVGGLAAAAGAEPDLVGNGSFEAVAGAAAVAWASTSDPKSGVISAVTLEPGKLGATAARIRCTAYPLPDKVIPTSHADLFQKGIGLVKGQPYRLSFWSKGQAVNSLAARVRLVDTSDWVYHPITKPLELTAAWSRTEIDFRAAKDVPAAGGMIWFTLDSVGDLWLDDVRLVCRPTTETPRYQPRVPAVGAQNLLPNSSFEAGTDGWATLGKVTGWGGDTSGLSGQIDAAEAYEGTQSLRLELGPGKTQVTYYDCWPASRQVQDAPLVANLGWIEVGKGQPLTLSAWLRADRAGVPAELVFVFGGDPTTGALPRRESRRVTLSERWERYAFTTNASEADVHVAVGPNLTAAADPAATVWIDALQLEQGATASAYGRRLPVEVGFVTGEAADFIPAGPAPSIRVSAANGNDTPSRLELTLELADYFGRPLPVQMLAVELPARARLDRDWVLRLPGTGFYRGRVHWLDRGLRQSRPLRFVTFSPYAEADSPFGINHAPVSAELVRALQRAGVTWARDWSILWGHLEPEPGKLSYAAADAQIQRLLDLGMHVVCLLPPLPATDWNSTAPAAVPPTQWQRMAYLPKDEEALFGFMTAAAACYRGKVDVLEFLNEPVWTEFCLPGAEHRKPEARYQPADYLRLLKRAYPALKAGNPDGRVIGGFSAEPWRFTEEFIAAGGLDQVDVLNLHNYGGAKPPEAFISEMKALLGRMDNAGKRRPIWITEYAYYGLDEFPWSPWEPLAGAWSHNRLLRDERQCADWSIRYALIMLAHGTEKIFYHQGAEGDVNHGSANVECPLLGAQGTPLKLYAAQAITAALLGAKPGFAGELAKPAVVAGRPTTGVYGYAFQCGPRAVLAVWCSESQAAAGPWALRVPPEVYTCDLMGNRVPGASVPLDVSPVYVTSTARAAAALASACELELPPAQSAPPPP
jgi:hypothetical protein